jgi:hypothetical protein
MKTVLRCFGLFLLLGLAGPLMAALPNTLNYQGRVRLNAGGAAVPDSTGNTMVFNLYSVATGGASLWTETWNSSTSNVATSAGLFNVVLGSYNFLTLPFDQQYWLGVSVNGDAEMSPRQALTLAPYAFRAKSVEGPVSVTSSTSVSAIHASAGSGGSSPTINSVNTGSGPAIAGQTASGPYAIQATNNSSTGNPYGVYAISSNSGGSGVYGQGGLYGVEGYGGAAATSGIYGYSLNSGGAGVYAYNAATVGNAYGVWGNSGGTSGGVGVFGQATAGAGGTGVYGSGTGNGVYGTASSGIGVYGVAGPSGSYGVRGDSSSQDGVLGTATSTSNGGVRGYGNLGSVGRTYGVKGSTNNGDANSAGVIGSYNNLATPSNLLAGAGVIGFNSVANGWGVYGAATGANGIGVVGSGDTVGISATAAGASGTGVYGSGNQYGVYGLSTGGNYGVWGQSSNIGVYGNSTGGQYGVYGNSSYVAVYGTAPYAVYGKGATNGTLGESISGSGYGARGYIGALGSGAALMGDAAATSTPGSPAIALQLNGGVGFSSRTDAPAGQVTVSVASPTFGGNSYGTISVSNNQVQSNSLIFLTPDSQAPPSGAQVSASYYGISNGGFIIEVDVQASTTWTGSIPVNYFIMTPR